MIDYLQQFNKLEPEIKNQISAPQVMQKLAQIEERYDLDLAIVVMRVAIKELKLSNLGQFFIDNFNLSLNTAKHLQQELEREVFVEIMNYLKTEEPVQDLSMDKINKSESDALKSDFSDSLDFDFKIGSAFIPTVSIEEIVQKAKLDLLDEFLLERLKNILNTYLKGIRSRVNTKETLSKSINTGGLNLSEIESDRVLKLADLQVSLSQKELLASKLTGQEMGRFVQTRSSLKSQTNQVNKASQISRVVKEKTLPALRLGGNIVPDYDLKTALKSGETKKISSGEKTALASGQKTALETKKPDLAIATPVSSEKPVVDEKPINMPSATTPTNSSRIVPPPKTSRSFFRKPEKIITTSQEKPSISQEKPSISQEKPSISQEKSSVKPIDQTISQITQPSNLITSSTPSIFPSTKLVQRREDSNRSGRVQVKDVKAVPRIMGPIEELLYLDVVNFRRLGSTPQETTKKIFNKIKLLEKSGYDKMIAGIKAWKRSPVNLLYLKILKEAMNSNLSIAQVIAIYQNQNQAYLTKEELDAIINLNSRLVF